LKSKKQIGSRNNDINQHLNGNKMRNGVEIKIFVQVFTWFN